MKISFRFLGFIFIIIVFMHGFYASVCFTFSNTDLSIVLCLCTFSITAYLTLFTEKDPDTVYPNQSVIWGAFEQAFLAVWGLVTYTPVFRDYYYQGLTQFYMDNVMYLEVRAMLPEVTCHSWTVQCVQWATRSCLHFFVI